MTQTFLRIVAYALLGGCVSGTTVLDPGDGGTATGSCTDAAPLPPLPPTMCTEPTAYGIGATTAPSGPPPIVIEPSAVLAGEVTVVSVARTGAEITLVVDDEGTTRTITIGDTEWPLEVTPGETVIARTTAGDEARWSAASLFLRRPTGELVAGFVRDLWSGASPRFAPLFHADIAYETNCVNDTGGQCSRGVVQLALVDGFGISRAAQGESLVATTPEGDIEIAVGALYNDGYFAPGTTVCAIGTLGSIALDARPAIAMP